MVVLFQFGADRLAQLNDARDRHILGKAFFNGGDRRLRNIFGRAKIRLTNIELDNVLALCFQRCKRPLTMGSTALQLSRGYLWVI